MPTVRHSHIVRIAGYGTTEGPRDHTDQPQRVLDLTNLTNLTNYYYIAMDFVPGDELDKTWAKYDGPTLLDVLEQLVDAVIPNRYDHAAIGSGFGS